MPNFNELIEIAAQRNLSEEEGAAAMTLLADGVPPPDQIRAFLLTPALSLEGVDAGTLTGLTRVVRARALPVPAMARRPVFDTCGTGGGAPTFNISTAAALCIAAAGIAVAKHGNRAVASNSGSTDVLEALGIPTGLSPESASHNVDARGFAFFFAQQYHRAFSYVQPVRRELAAEGRRTAFNFVGPLANPVNVTHQIVGAFLPDKLNVLAEVLRRLGTEAALCVSGMTERGEPMDEISLSSETKAVLLRDGTLTERTFTPEEFGLERMPVSGLSVKTAAESAHMIREIFEQKRSGTPEEAIVVINTAAAFYLTGFGEPPACTARARDIIASGAALTLLKALSHGA